MQLKSVARVDRRTLGRLLRLLAAGWGVPYRATKRRSVRNDQAFQAAALLDIARHRKSTSARSHGDGRLSTSASDRFGFLAMAGRLRSRCTGNHWRAPRAQREPRDLRMRSGTESAQTLFCAGTQGRGRRHQGETAASAVGPSPSHEWWFNNTGGSGPRRSSVPRGGQFDPACGACDRNRNRSSRIASRYAWDAGMAKSQRERVPEDDELDQVMAAIEAFLDLKPRTHWHSRGVAELRLPQPATWVRHPDVDGRVVHDSGAWVSPTHWDKARAMTAGEVERCGCIPTTPIASWRRSRHLRAWRRSRHSITNASTVRGTREEALPKRLPLRAGCSQWPTATRRGRSRGRTARLSMPALSPRVCGRRSGPDADACVDACSEQPDTMCAQPRLAPDSQGGSEVLRHLAGAQSRGSRAPGHFSKKASPHSSNHARSRTPSAMASWSDSAGILE